ncbi:MAG: multidrug effflux MFS transporter [Coxiellaceae bacterium]|nr:multidrug effflux MFS transporter [Coxiellaceae bacterium]
MRDKSIVYVVTVLAPLVFSFALALDLYIPSVPDIAAVYQVSSSTVQLTLSLFMFMQGLGQLLFGPLSDRFGRKPIALISAGLFILASIACGVSPNIDDLIIARIFQAAGACGMTVVAFAMVRDLFEKEVSAKVYSYLNSTIAVSPLMAPIVGAYMACWLGWRSNFYLLGLIGVGCFVLIAFAMRETQLAHHKADFNWSVFKRYWQIYSQRRFYPNVLMAGCAIAVFFSFFSISPFIIIKLLHVPEIHFGYYFAVLGVVFLCGSIVAGKIAPQVGVRRVLFAGVMLVLFGGLLMWGWYAWLGLSLSEFLVPLIFSGMGASFMAGSSAAMALEPFPEVAGTAASLLGASQFVFSAVVASIMMDREIVSTQPYAITLVVLGAISFILFIVSRSK